MNKLKYAQKLAIYLLFGGAGIYIYFLHGQVAAREKIIADLISANNNLARKNSPSLANRQPRKEDKPAERTVQPVMTSEPAPKRDVATAVPYDPKQKNDLNARLKQDIEYAPFWRQQQRRYVLKNNSLAIEALQLTPENAEKLKNLLVDRIDTLTDAGALAREAGLSGVALKQAMDSAVADLEKKIQETIGTDKYDLFKQDIVAASIYKTRIEDIALDMNDRGLSLTAVQQVQMARLFNSTPGVDALSNQERFATARSQIAARAADFLTTDQMQAFKKLNEDAVKQNEILRRITNQAGKADGAK